MNSPVWNPEAGGPIFRLELDLRWPDAERHDGYFVQTGPLGLTRRLRELADVVERAYPPVTTCLCPNPHCPVHGTATPAHLMPDLMQDVFSSPQMQVRHALDVDPAMPWDAVLEAIHHGTLGPPRGCCSACSGRGGDETGPCPDCRQTGHPHAPEMGCGQEEKHASDAAWLSTVIAEHQAAHQKLLDDICAALGEPRGSLTVAQALEIIESHVENDLEHPDDE